MPSEVGLVVEDLRKQFQPAACGGAVAFFLTDYYLGDYGTWILVLIFLFLERRPLSIGLAIVAGALGLSPYHFIIVWTLHGCVTSMNIATFVSFFGPTAIMRYFYPPVAQILFSSPDWAKLLSLSVLFAITVTPRSLQIVPDDANRALPEHRQGIWPALVIQGSKIYFGTRGQWFVYALIFLLGLTVVGSGASSGEGVVLSVAAWWLGYSPVVAYSLFELANVLYHPLRRRLFHRGGFTPVLRSQQSGFMWFLLVHTFLEVLVGLGGHWIKPLVTALLWTTLALSMAATVGVQIFQATSLRRTRPSSVLRDADGRLAPYEYSRLRTSSTFRILRIRPSWSKIDPIQCEMVEGDFHNETVHTGPAYTAISYVWDKPGSPKKTIYIDGQPFEVYTTVFDILHTLRSPLLARCVWIDSVCIHQADDNEKAQQVQLMRHIYQNCSWAMGWVGSGREISGSHVKDFWKTSTNTVGEGKSSEYLAKIMLSRLSSSKYLQHISPDDSPSAYIKQHSPEHWEALRKLVSSPFFTRLWIIQEMVASRHVTLHYGGEFIPWSMYARAMTVLASHGLRNSMAYQANGTASQADIQATDLSGIDNSLVMENLRRWYRRESGLIQRGQANRLLPLEDTLKLCLRFNSTLDVDRIYALLGLSSDGKELGIIPDYTPERKDLAYTTAARQMILRSDPFRTLRFAGIGQARRLKTLPSWVPDWSGHLEASVLSHQHPQHNYRATDLSVRSVLILPNDLLRIHCKGVIVDTITVLSSVFTGRPTTGTTQFRDALALSEESLPESYQSMVPVSEAFWRTILGDMDPQRRPASQEFLDAWRDTITTCESLSDGQPVKQKDDFEDSQLWLDLNDSDNNRYRHMLTTDLSQAHPNHRGEFTDLLGSQPNISHVIQHPLPAFGRRLCITEGSFMGLVPAGSEAGDQIALLQGAMIPHILRRSGGSEPRVRYQLVGECYVHGMMDGEKWEQGKRSGLIILE